MGFAGSAPAGPPPTASVSIEFLADGRCTVTAGGEGFHSQMTYTPQASTDSSDLRCAVPPVPGGRRVDLTVILPAGRRPSGGGSPELSWAEKEGRWQGEASLDAAPEVVVVEDWNSPASVRRRWGTRAAFAGAGLVVMGGLAAFLRRRNATPAV
jgi:hypothetical protein